MGQTFGLEPNYPCCTVNHPQGYPQFVSAAFVRQGHNGIAHALLGTMSVLTPTKSGTQVRIVCETEYPFTQWLVYTVDADGPFDLSVRIARWSASPTISDSRSIDAPLRGAAPGTPTAMLKIPIDQGLSGVIVTLSAKSTCNTAPTTPKPCTTATCSTRFRAIHTNLPASPGLPRSSRQHTKL
jgi:hypothetical protein